MGGLESSNSFETVTETKRVVQVTCQLEGKEELQDFLLSKRMRREVQVEVRFG